MRIVARMVVPLSVFTMVVVGCSPDDAATTPPPTSATAVPAITNSAVPASPTPDSRPVRDTSSKVATSKSQTIDVYTSPNKPDFQTISATDVLTVADKTPLVFLVKTVTDGWLQVWLPVRPNGATGWVRTDDVTVADTRFWIDVTLSDFSLKVYNDEDMVFETAIGVGQDDLPTPH